MKSPQRKQIRAVTPVVMLTLAALGLAGCAVAPAAPKPAADASTANAAATGSSAAPSADGSGSVLGGEKSDVILTPVQIRDRMRSFADYYRDKVEAVCDQLASEAGDPLLAGQIQQLKIDAATAMYDIAVDPAPTTAMINALVMVSLQAETAAAHAVTLFGDQAGPQIVALSQEIQEQAFGLAARVMTEKQRQRLLDMVKAWLEQNPDETNIWYMRLNDLPGVRGQVSVLETVDALTDLPSKFLGKFIPGVSGVSEAGETVSDVNLLAERMSWLAPRLVILAQWRAEMLVYRCLQAPQVAESLDVARRVTHMIEILPDTLDQQRAALFNDLEQHDEVVNGLLERTDAVAGRTTELLAQLDTVIARIQTMIAATAIANAGKPQSDVPARPFDITEYTAALAELDTAAQSATALLNNVEAATDEHRLAQKLNVVKTDLSGLIWLAGGVLGGAVALAGLLIVLAVKLIPRRG